MRIHTIGHSHRSPVELIEMLQNQGIGCLVDIRRHPSSRRFPQFNSATLQESLLQAGIRYYWEGWDLGGLRISTPNDERHSALKDGFRAFASHMETSTFRLAIDRLLKYACMRRTVLLCAEREPAYCHRSLIADFLTVRDYDVRHLVDRGEYYRHELHPEARVERHHLVYDGVMGHLMPQPLFA
jgi:uncharacterized protein (DUF488 family)